MRRAKDVQGIYFEAVESNPVSNWSTTNACNFAYKAEWLDFPTSGAPSWLEVGRLNGAAIPYRGNPTPINKGYCGSDQVNFYNAYSTAYVLNGNYIQRIIVGPSTSGNHTYNIYLDTTEINAWGIDIDGVRRLTVGNYPYTSGYRQSVGWETNTSSASFITPNDGSYIQGQELDGVYYLWDSGTVFNSDGKGLGWQAGFPSGYFYNATFTASSSGLMPASKKIAANFGDSPASNKNRVFGKQSEVAQQFIENMEATHTPPKHVKFPAERLHDNRSTPEAKLLSVEAVKESMKSYVPNSGKITLVELTTLEAIEKETHERFHEVSPHRQVYKVVVETPRLYHIMLGWVENAKQTTAIDAETGEGLGTMISGKWDTPLIHQ